MLTSQQLADVFRSQSSAPGGLLRINDALLQITGLDALIRRDLQRADGTLLLRTDPAQIPPSPPPSGFTLDDVAIPSGADGFLNLAGRRASIAFTFDTTIEISLAVETRTAATGAAVPWVFSTSFPVLAEQPYDSFDLEDPELTFSNAGADPGLRFSADVAPTGFFTPLVALLGLSNRYRLAGRITRDDRQDLSFSLDAELGIPEFGIDDIITLINPRIGAVYAQQTRDDSTTSEFVQIFLGATITLGSGSADVLVGMPIVGVGTPILQLMVLPVAGGMSLSTLGSLVAGQTWDGFFSGPALELKRYFDTFGFLGYTMTFTTRAKVASLSLSVGTLQPWTLWGDYTLTLDGTWNVVFLAGRVAQTILLHAGFDYDQKMRFDVTVELPRLRISGHQSGAPIALSLKDVADKLFDGGISVPEDLLQIAVSAFTIDINKAAKIFGIGAVADASFSLFGAQILALRQMAIHVTVDTSGATKKYTATLDGQISLGPISAQVDAVLSNDRAVGTVFTLHLVDETVGSMLGHLVHLVDPTYDVSFGAPWDKLLDVRLDAFVLRVDVTNKVVSLAYEASVDLGFLSITELALSWKKNPTGPSTTRIEISGTFLGVRFGTGSSNPKLSWDPINENPPAVPGAGDKMFDLRYVGIGQHVSFDPAWKPQSVEEAIDKMEKLALPAGGSNLPNLTSKGGLRFAKDSGWLVGADFTLLQTLKLTFVFNDPNLYGILIALSGERAKSFAGLKFEILYRKVTDTIGVYHIELKLPDAMRHLEFGEVSLTLPVVVLDIYTNGNFRVDLGFPKGLDFSSSFCLQVFPFIGYGGFYFALLDGDTSSRVPRITNGRFSPVIELGIALSVGVGKTIDEGILTGGLSVTVVGVLQGAIGWFDPTDAATPKDEYYWLQGTIAITGRLYGSIDFAIVQASVSITAYASATLVIEAHQPIYISLSVSVSVEVSVKIVFFTIHCSFQATISASFTIGSASPAPWTLAQPSGSASRHLFARRGSVHAPQRRFFAGLARHERLARMAARLAAGDVTLAWSARAVFASPRAVPLRAMPAFTRAGGGLAMILLLGIEDGIPARAGSLAAHAAPLDGAAGPGVGDVLEGLVRWAIANARASLGKPVDDGRVDADDVALANRALADDEALASAIDYTAYLADFLDRNYRFSLSAPQAGGGGDTGVGVFPMPPVLKVTAGGAPPIDFASFNPLDETTLEKMRAYFALLAVDYEKFVAQQGGAAGPSARAAIGGTTPIAQVVLEQYFAMLLRAAVKAAGDVLHGYAFAYADSKQPFGLAEIRAQLGAPGLSAIAVVPANRDKAVLAPAAPIALDGVHHQIKLGESFASIAAAFNAVLPASAQITAQQIAAQNAGAAGVLRSGAAVTFASLSWTTLAGETLNLVLARLAVRAAGAPFVQGFPGLQPLAQEILALPGNAGLFPAGTDPIAALNLPIDPARRPQLAMPPGAAFAAYATVAGDTLIRVAATSIAIQQSRVDLFGMVAWVLAHNTLTVTDPSAPQPPGTTIALPPMTRAIWAGETAASLATRLLTDLDAVIAALLAVAPEVNLLAPQALLALPPLSYEVRAGDTFASIAALFNLTLEAIEAAIDGAGALAIFAPGAAVTVADVTEMALDALVPGLAATQWTTLAPMASRFLLAGLRLPDPSDGAFERLTIAEMRDPAKLGAITTLPLYALTGQQIAITSPPPAGYTIAFDQSVAAPCLSLPGTLGFELTPEQIAVIGEIAGAAFAPSVELSALPLFRLAAARSTLQQHIAWQPAALPDGAVFNPVKLGNVAGNPDLWVFPDPLVARLAADGARQPPYTVAIGTHQSADGMTVTYAKGFAWATLLRFSVQQLPADEAAAETAATIVSVVGTDGDGIALLDAIDAQLTHDGATLYLLYPPSPAGGAEAGLLSDQLAPATALVQTNLSTLSHSGAAARPLRNRFLVRDDGAAAHVAPITSAGAFLRLIRDASIARSGGYSLRYVNASGGAGLPGALFTSGPVAELALLVVLDSQNTAHPPMLPFNNCAIVGDNVDAASSNVFVEAATWLVAAPSALADAAAFAEQRFGIALDAGAVATLNADVPQLLRPGATVEVPDGAGGSKTDAVRIDDTLATLAGRSGLTPAALAAFGRNAAAPILAPTGLVQLYPGALARTAAIPAGSAGFQLTRAHPDPGNARALTEMDGAAILDELFHMLGHRVVPNASGDPGFLKSGEGIPVGPAQSRPTEGGGAPPPGAPNTRWDYHQAIAIAPFALGRHGSASPALPAAAESPYAGVAPGAAVTLAFAFHDPFGNTMPVPGGGSLTQPVRYVDDLVGLGQWPSCAAGYSLAGGSGGSPSIGLRLSMQTERYLPTAALSSARAAQNVGADLATYLRVYYQIAQPDVGFALATTLEGGGAPILHDLPIQPFRDFVAGAWVVLDALRATQPVVFAPSSAATTIGSVADTYGIALSDLFAANGEALYAAVFGGAALSIPALYTTVAGDSLASIAAANTLDPVMLARQNPWAALSTTVVLAAPARTVQPGADDALATLAAATQASVAGIAQANPTAPLTDGLSIAVAGVAVTTSGDDFTSLAEKLGDLGLPVTIGEIAVANQTTAGLFRTPVTLTIDDVAPLPGDSLGALQQRFGFTITALAAANEDLADLYAAGTSLFLGPGSASSPSGDGVTIAQFAAQHGVSPGALGRALYLDLQPATPPAVNQGAILASTAKLTIPATVTNDGADRCSAYRALATDADLATIAAKFAGDDPAALGALNLDRPGLLAAGITVRDAATGRTVQTDASSTFASLAAAFAAIGATVTPGSLARDNASTPSLPREGGLWLCPPMIAIAQEGGAPDTLARIAARYGLIAPDGAPDAARVARANAAVLGFVAPGVSLSLGGVALVTLADDTLNALLGRLARPGAPAPSIDDLAPSIADVALVPPGALLLPVAVENAVSATIAPSFAGPIVRLGVTVTEARTPAWIADAFKAAASVATSAFEVPPDTGAGGAGASALSLDALATAVEAALPGVRVATGDPPTEADDASDRTLWIVNFAGPYGPQIAFQLRGASALRSFAIPPLSTSLVSGTAQVTPYVSGAGLTGTPLPIVFASIDLDVWGASFLAAMDTMLSPVYAVPASEASLDDLERIVAAKQRLAQSIAGRVQYVMHGGGPGEYGDPDPRRAAAIAAMDQALLVTLSSAYSITSLVQAAVDVSSGYTDPVTAPRLSGKATLTQPASSAPVRNASLSTAKVPLARTTAADPAPLTFLLTVQSAAEQRSATVDLDYAVGAIEVPSGAPDPDGYQPSRWLTLVHPIGGDREKRGKIDSATLPIPLRAYPLPPTLVSQTATASYGAPYDAVDQLARWDADAAYSRQDAAQDTGRLRLSIGVELGAGDRAIARTGDDPIFAALAQFVSVYPALQRDLALLTTRAPGAPPDLAVQNAVAAFAAIASAVAAAWPSNALVPKPPARLSAVRERDEIAPGAYTYTLLHTDDGSGDLVQLDLVAEAGNPMALWPQLAVDTGDCQGFRPLQFVSSSGATGVYQYPPKVPAGISLVYRVRLSKLDVVMIPYVETGVAVQRNADLIEGETTCELFIYSTPYTSFSSALVPRLLVPSDFDVGSGSIGDLKAALRSFLVALLARSAAPAGSTRVLRVAASYGYELTRPVAATAVRGRASRVGSAGSISTHLPAALVPSVELVINGDGGAQIDAFAAELAGFVADWDRTVQPSHTNAAVFFDVSLFSEAAGFGDKPLLTVRSVRYGLVDTESA
ncbi:LysM peptidoglycan-binding domain-containing protein [Sorangium sp. So ce693]|uniref:LysM peptidoglycan-binding domain-containing protein n=1 Tax=Sorangium sp. So ce693 TaxID=3133318 RepID=UPI003F627249